MAEKDLWYPPNTHVFMFQLDSKHDYENDNSGLLVVEDITIVIRSFRKRKTSYRLTNPIESARMKESLAESMGFS